MGGYFLGGFVSFCSVGSFFGLVGWFFLFFWCVLKMGPSYYETSRWALLSRGFASLGFGVQRIWLFSDWVGFALGFFLVIGHALHQNVLASARDKLGQIGVFSRF